MPFQHLKREERNVIYHLVVFGLSYREIARRLDRAPSTIAREIKRNSGTFNYWHEHAQVKRNERASAAHLDGEDAGNRSSAMSKRDCVKDGPPK